MAYRVSIDELGIANDNTVIEGETPGDVWRRVQEELKDKHKIDIPDLDQLGDQGIIAPGIMQFDNSAVAGGQAPVVAGSGHFGNGDNLEARTIVARLLEKLHLGQQGPGNSDILPPGGTQSTMP